MSEENTLKLDDFLKFTGIEVSEDMTQEKFHEAFRERFIQKDKAHDDETVRKTVTGRVLGSLRTEFNKYAREFGVEFGEEMKDAKFEDLFNHTFTEIKKKSESKINEIKSAYDPSKKDEVVKEWEGKYNKLEKKYTEQKNLFDTRIQEFDAFKENTQKETKNFKIKTLYQNSVSKAKFKEGTSDLEKKGFEAHLKDNYKFDLDDEGNFWALDGKTGEKIAHPDKMDAYMNFDEIINRDLKVTNLAPVNDKAETRRPLGASVTTVATSQSANGDKNAKRVHPRAAQA